MSLLFEGDKLIVVGHNKFASSGVMVNKVFRDDLLGMLIPKGATGSIFLVRPEDSNGEDWEFLVDVRWWKGKNRYGTILYLDPRDTEIAEFLKVVPRRRRPKTELAGRIIYRVMGYSRPAAAG